MGVQPILVISQIMVLFINCILAIDNYNKSYCLDPNVDCQPYVNLSNPTIKSMVNQEIIIDLNVTTIECANISDINNDSLRGKWGISIMFLILSIICLILSIMLIFFKDDDDDYLISNIITILFCVFNIIVSAFSIFIYEKCINKFHENNTCTGYGPYYQDKVNKKNIYGTCSGVVSNFDTAHGMYVFMILLLCTSLLSGATYLYFLLK